MLSRKNIIFTIALFMGLSIFIAFGSYFYILKKQENLLNSIYNSTHLNIKNSTENLIQDKLNTTLAMALSLAKSETLYQNIQNKSYENLNYKKIIKEINENSKYKNVWIQIINNKGNSIYRSWTDKKGDNLLFRNDLKNTLENEKIDISISSGIFNLTLKARTPIYDDKENFLGTFEVITHFNSIAEDLKENNIQSLVLTDKSFSKFIQFPFSNIFIDDYYIANDNVDSDLLNYFKDKNIEEYLNIENYIIENGYLISNYTIYDQNNYKLAYIFNFLKLDNIDLQTIESFKIQIIMISVIAFILVFFTFLIYLYSRYLKDIKNQENKKQSILDSQSSIIIITDGCKIIDANKRLFEFFPECKNLKNFRETYTCICKNFIDMKKDDYIIEKDYDGKNWAEYVLENNNTNFKVAMKNIDNEIRHFLLKTSILNFENYIIATFSDITLEINNIEKDKEKDRILFQQSKIAAIADTIKNIAHQWRQPLSVISTISSGMKLKKEMATLSDDDFYKSCDTIIDNTQKLSFTIENFTDFFTKNDNISNFSIIEAMAEILNFFESIFEKNGIESIFNYDNDIVLNCNKSDFSQAILNIIDNSIYALIKNKEANDRFIFIDFSDNILQIKDNANGIEESILSKVLDPYVTTKHQSFGVGLGLYIVQEFFVKKLAYKINVENVNFEYNNKKYLGANFIIDFN